MFIIVGDWAQSPLDPGWVQFFVFWWGWGVLEGYWTECLVLWRRMQSILDLVFLAACVKDP